MKERAVTYSVVPRVDPRDISAEMTYYARAQARGEVTLGDMARRIRLSNVKLPTLYVKTEIAAEYFFQFTSVYIRIRHKAHINSFTYQGFD